MPGDAPTLTPEIELAGHAKVQRPYQKVADQLLADIIAGKYPVGTRLPSERRLAEQFDVGRPVIREAIVALEILDAVAVKPNSGIYVIPQKDAAQPGDIDLDAGAFELFEARLLIEGEIAFLAATMLTDETLQKLETIMENMREANANHEIEKAEAYDGQFHETIAESINNSVLQGMVAEMRLARRRSPLATRLLARIHGRGIGRRIEEHADILRALQARDAHSARAAMRRHMGCVIAELAAATELEVATGGQADSEQSEDAIRAGATRRSIVRLTSRS